MSDQKPVQPSSPDSLIQDLEPKGPALDKVTAKLNDKVVPGQKVAIQRNSFGDVVAEYSSGVDGKITGQRSDAMSEPGNPLLFILFNKATREGVETYPE